MAKLYPFITLSLLAVLVCTRAQASLKISTSTCSTQNVLSRLFSSGKPSISIAPMWVKALDKKTLLHLDAVLGAGDFYQRQSNLNRFWQLMAEGDQQINFASIRQKLISFQSYLKQSKSPLLNEKEAMAGFRELIRAKQVFFNDELQVLRRGQIISLSKLEELRVWHLELDKVIERLKTEYRQADLIGDSIENTAADLRMMSLSPEELEARLKEVLNKCTR